MIGLDLLAGVLCLVSAAAVGLRQIVLDPRFGSWPDAGDAVRLAMFLVMVTFAYRGVELVGLGLAPGGPTMTPAAVAAFGALAAYNVVMAINVLRQVLPPHVWDRLKRVNHLAFWPPRGKLALLALAGFHVYPPGAPPREVLDEVNPSGRRAARLPESRKVPTR